MSDTLTVRQALEALRPLPGLVILMCGVAGSGKTTFSQALEAKGFLRLSIDEEVWSTSGRYGVDYPPTAYDANVESARERLKEKLAAAVSRSAPTVVDSAFWSRRHRDDFKDLIQRGGGRWRLIFLDVPQSLLAERIAQRRRRFDANAALPITPALLQAFLTSFEPPTGEGETVVCPD